MGCKSSSDKDESTTTAPDDQKQQEPPPPPFIVWVQRAKDQATLDQQMISQLPPEGDWLWRHTETLIFRPRKQGEDGEGEENDEDEDESSTLLPLQIPMAFNEACWWQTENLSHWSALKECIVEEGIEIISHHFLRECASLTTVSLPSSLRSVGISFLLDCPGVTSLSIPDGPEPLTAGEHFLHNCRGLTTLSFPKKLKTVGNWFLYGCENITSLTLPDDGLVTAGSTFLEGLYKLHTLILPNSLETIGDTQIISCKTLQINHHAHNWHIFESACGVRTIVLPRDYPDDAEILPSDFCRGEKGIRVRYARRNDGDGDDDDDDDDSLYISWEEFTTQSPPLQSSEGENDKGQEEGSTARKSRRRPPLR